MKSLNEILEQKYVTARDLQQLIPGLGYISALKEITNLSNEANKMGYYVPKSKTKVALTWLVKKKFGIK